MDTDTAAKLGPENAARVNGILDGIRNGYILDQGRKITIDRAIDIVESFMKQAGLDTATPGSWPKMGVGGDCSCVLRSVFERARTPRAFSARMIRELALSR